jgi:hypothetical protein
MVGATDDPGGSSSDPATFDVAQTTWTYWTSTALLP